jgi:hypothetical protein
MYHWMSQFLVSGTAARAFEVLVYRASGYRPAPRIGPPPPDDAGSALQALLRKAKRRSDGLMHLDETCTAIDTDVSSGRVTAMEQAMVRFFRAAPLNSPARLAQDINTTLLVELSFVSDLPWTQAAPAQWWWPTLDRLAHRVWGGRILPLLPAAFLPRERLAAIIDDPEIGPDVLAYAHLCPTADPSLVAACVEGLRVRHSPASGPELLATLRVRRDLPALAPVLTPILLGHPVPQLAALGLELLAGHHPPVPTR